MFLRKFWLGFPPKAETKRRRRASFAVGARRSGIKNIKFWNLKKNMFYVKRMVKSFKHALSGFRSAFLGERNFRIMVLLVLFSVLIGFFYASKTWEIVALIIVGIMMLVVELINTAFERSLDLVTKHHDDNIKYIKDIMASAALVASLAWLVVLILIVVY